MKHASRAAALVASAAIGAALALGAFIATEGTSDSPTPATRTIVEGTASPAAVTTSAKSVADIYAGSVSGVVEIRVHESATGQSITPFGPTQQTQLAQGTGFEIDRNGDIATNAHVVSGASSITRPDPRWQDLQGDAGRKRPDHRRGRHPHRRAVCRSAPAHVR